MFFRKKHCVPCEGGVPALTAEERQLKLQNLSGWKLNELGHLTKEFVFKDFVQNMKFINKVAKLAEQEGHHPDFKVHYNKVVFDIYTHSIKGLSENDFILAELIEKVK